MSDSLTPLSLPINPLRLSGETTRIKTRMERGQFPAKATDPQKLRKTCSELESLFIFQLLKEMRATIPKSGYLSGGKGEEIYTSMLDAQVARDLAAERGIGLSSFFENQLQGKSSVPDKKNEEK